jgi:hypothetical protein
MYLPWSFVSKTTNSKHQITNKSQNPNPNEQNLSGELMFGFSISVMGICLLSDI